MVSARLSSLTDCSQLTSWLSEYAWSSTVRITSTCPLPKMRPDHALGVPNGRHGAEHGGVASEVGKAVECAKGDKATAPTEAGHEYSRHPRRSFLTSRGP